MKVVECTATGNGVMLYLEPEHPAEIALFKLLDGCSATIQGNGGLPAPKEKDVKTVDGIVINAVVKQNPSYR